MRSRGVPAGGLSYEVFAMESQELCVNVRNFGAQGDGVTDDAAAIGTALTAVKASGGIVCLPPGTYLLGTPLSLSSNVTLLGAGADATTICSHSALGANRLIVIQGTCASRVKNIHISGLTFCNGTASTGNPTSGKDGIRAEYV